jgi:hypothetical protein
MLLGTGSKENTAAALAGQVISESGDLFGLHGVENTKLVELRFTAVLASGLSDIRFERTTLSQASIGSWSTGSRSNAARISLPVQRLTANFALMEFLRSCSSLLRLEAV